jgi:hypothetical protein
MDPETYFRLLEPDDAKRAKIIETLQLVLNAPIDKRRILIIRGPNSSGKTVLMRLLLSCRVSQTLTCDMVGSRKLGSQDWMIDFDTTHFVKSTTCNYGKRIVNSLAWFDEFTNGDSIPKYDLWYHGPDSKAVIVPKIWFVIDPSDSDHISPISIPTRMERRIVYLDLTQTFNYDRFARDAIRTALDNMNHVAWEAFVVNYRLGSDV